MGLSVMIEQLHDISWLYSADSSNFLSILTISESTVRFDISIGLLGMDSICELVYFSPT